MICWILYDPADLERNRFFAKELTDAGRSLGIKTEIVTTDSIEGVPDVVVSRVRDPDVSKRLEFSGAQVFNSSEICRICNDKLATYRLINELGIPHLLCSLPGEPFPPGPPWVVKSRSGHGGSEVFMAKDFKEVEKLCGRIRDPIIQQVAPILGRDMRAYVLDGEVLACVMRSSDSDFRANFSCGGRAEPCGIPDICSGIIDKITERLHPTFIGIDFVFGREEIYLNEIEDVVGTRMLYSLTDLDPARTLMETVHSKSSL